MKIDPKHLIAIETIRRQGGLTRAAESLGTSQPALSRLVSDLESRLGASLFEREQRPWRLTALGESLAVEGVAVLNAQARAGAEWQRFHTGVNGTIRFCGPPFFTDGVIASHLPAFRARHADVSFEVSYAYAAELRDSVRSGRVDLGFYPLGVGDQLDELEFTRLLDARNVIVCREGHPILRLAYPRPLALLDYGWVVPPAGSPLAADMESVLSDLEMHDAQIAFTGASLAGVLNFVQASDCLTVLPESTARTIGQWFGIRQVPIETSTPKRVLGILTRSNRELNRTCQTFIEFLRTQFHPHRGSDQVKPT